MYFHRLLKGFNELLNENYKISYKSKILQRCESTVFGKPSLSVHWEEWLGKSQLELRSYCKKIAVRHLRQLWVEAKENWANRSLGFLTWGEQLHFHLRILEMRKTWLAAKTKGWKTHALVTATSIRNTALLKSVSCMGSLPSPRFLFNRISSVNSIFRVTIFNVANLGTQWIYLFLLNL